MTLLMLMLMLMLMLILENMTYWMTLQVLTQVDGGVCELLDDAADTDAGKCLNPFFPFTLSVEINLHSLRIQFLVNRVSE